jgi:hypothetical protein
MRIEADIVTVEMLTHNGGHFPAQYQQLSYPREIQELCARMLQDVVTLVPHLSRHSIAIRDEERFCLEEGKKTMTK